VPDFHLASGIVDMLGHIFERYFSLTENTELINAMGEAAMRTVIEQGKKVMADRDDINALAEIVLCGTMAHNDILGIGRIQDWACHKMEHELSAKWDITHGSGLAIMYPAWLKFLHKNGETKQLAVMERFAKSVFGISGDNARDNANNNTGENARNNAIEKTISALEEFYKTIGMPIKLGDLNISPTDEEIETMAKKALHTGKTLGNFYKLTKADIIEIYNIAK
jgi:alcohol dehydrogenase YqhD (iron-dependent ADH family)